MWKLSACTRPGRDHDLCDAREGLTLADRIAVMKDRTFQQIGRCSGDLPASGQSLCGNVRRFACNEFRSGAHRADHRRPVFRSAFPPVAAANLSICKRLDRRTTGGAGHSAGTCHRGTRGGRCSEVSVEMSEPMGSDLLTWTRLGDLPCQSGCQRRRADAVCSSAYPAARTSFQPVRTLRVVLACEDPQSTEDAVRIEKCRSSSIRCVLLTTSMQYSMSPLVPAFAMLKV